MVRNQRGRFVRQSDDNENNKQEALSMLKGLQEKIKKGDLTVMTQGFWEGIPGLWTFRVIVKESDKSKLF